MRPAVFLIILVVFASCSLFDPFRKTNFTLVEEGEPKTYSVVIPKGFRQQAHADSAGVQSAFYKNRDGTSLYFIKTADTSIAIQPIHYPLNIPQELYHTHYFKGIDSSGFYWRETRFGSFKAGYYHAEPGEEWIYDSVINYFSLLFRPDSIQKKTK